MFLGVFEAFERHCATVDDQVRQLSSQPGSLQIVCCPFNFILISAELLETSFVLCYSEEAHRTFFFVDDFLGRLTSWLFLDSLFFISTPFSGTE